MMDEQTKAYLVKLLTVMGQMNHIPSKKGERTLDLMTIKTEDRRDLIDEGHKLLQSLKA